MNSEELEYIQRKLFTKPNKEHIEWLEKKNWWNGIHTKFQKYLSKLVPYTHLVPKPCADDDMRRILGGRGQMRIVYDNDDIIVNVMEEYECHSNSKKLMKQGKIKQLHIGYALSTNGLWYQHSWGIDFDNKIVETTEQRIVYLTSFCWSK